MLIVNGIDVTDYKFVKGETPSASDHYDKTIVQPFVIDEAVKCCNLRWKEQYEEPAIKKVIPLYSTYTRKNSMLQGQGDLIGYMAYITGRAYRGVGAVGGLSKQRKRGISIVVNKGTKMETQLASLGLYNPKRVLFKNLTADVYTLVSKIRMVVYTNGNTLRYLEIGLLGNDGSYIDLTTKYFPRMTLDFK